MFPILDQYEGSGLTKVEFCRIQAIPIAVFWYWYRKYREQEVNTEHHFVEVKELPLTGIKMEFEYREMRLSFYELPPVGYLKEILNSR